MESFVLLSFLLVFLLLLLPVFLLLACDLVCVCACVCALGFGVFVSAPSSEVVAAEAGLGRRLRFCMVG